MGERRNGPVDSTAVHFRAGENRVLDSDYFLAGISFCWQNGQFVDILRDEPLGKH